MTSDELQKKRPKARSLTKAMRKFEGDPRLSKATPKASQEVFSEVIIGRPDSASVTRIKAGQGKEPFGSVGAAKADSVDAPRIPPVPRRMSASYVFKGGRCVCISAQHSFPWSDVQKERKKFIEGCANELGAEFDRKCLPLVTSRFSYLSPALVWKKGDCDVILIIIPDFSEIRMHTGEIRIMVSTEGENPMEKHLQEPREDDRKRLFDCISECLVTPANKEQQ